MSRVTPLKLHTIPRLELMVALMAIRLCTTVLKKLDIHIDNVFYHTDSTTVLRWINSVNCRYHVYVGNRIGEILEYSLPSQWHYVPTDLNPADDCSRGVTATDLTIQHHFFAGPDFLRQSQEHWPSFPTRFNTTVTSVDPEVRSENWVYATHRDIPDNDDPIDLLIVNCSNINRLIRVVAYVRLWIVNYRQKKLKQQTMVGNLSAAELKSSSNSLVAYVQKTIFKGEVDSLLGDRPLKKESNLVSLTPYINERGVSRRWQNGQGAHYTRCSSPNHPSAQTSADSPDRDGHPLKIGSLIDRALTA